MRSDGSEGTEYSVVWWDPSALALDAKAAFGVRRDDLIVKDVPRHVVADGRSRYDRWHLARADARAAGAVPSLQVETVREWSSEGQGRLEELGAVQTAVLDVWRDRPQLSAAMGMPFGVLVHAVLAQVPFDAPREVVDRVAGAEARLLGLDTGHARAAAERVERVLGHELFARARAAAVRGACRRETPVTCLLSTGQIVEGVVDLAFEEQGTWIVVDYKTDAELAANGEEKYRRQLALYAAAIARTTASSALGVLLRV
jgi:ATP-dependent exoDNAse (exonuclease V) beta subunit